MAASERDYRESASDGAKEGGAYKMPFTNFTTGKTHSFGGKYLELVPHERIRYTDIFDDPNLPGEIQVTITLKNVSCGTDYKFCRKGCRTSSLSRPVISAGENRGRCWPNSSKRRFPTRMERSGSMRLKVSEAITERMTMPVATIWQISLDRTMCRPEE